MSEVKHAQILNFPVFVQILFDSKKGDKKNGIFQKKDFVEGLVDYINENFGLNIDELLNCSEAKKWHDGSSALTELQNFLNSHSEQLEKLNPFFDNQLKKINKKECVEILKDFLAVDKIEYPDKDNISKLLNINTLSSFLPKLLFVAVTRGDNRSKNPVKEYDSINQARIKFNKKKSEIITKTRKKYIIAIIGLVLLLSFFVIYHFIDKKEQKFISEATIINSMNLRRSNPVLSENENIFYNGEIFETVENVQSFKETYKDKLSLNDTEKPVDKLFSCISGNKEKYITLSNERNTMRTGYYYETDISGNNKTLISRYKIIVNSSFPEIELTLTEENIIDFSTGEPYELDQYFSQNNDMVTSELANAFSGWNVYINANNLKYIAKNSNSRSSLKVILISKNDKSYGRYCVYSKNSNGKFSDDTSTDFYPLTIKYAYD